MSDRMEFARLDELQTERPTDLPASEGERRLSREGTPLRATAAESQRQTALRNMILVVCVFGGVVTVALAFTLVAGHTQVKRHGAAVSNDGRCSRMAVEVQRRGGNAVDSAITCMLCVGLLQPQHSGIGGGGFMVVHNHRNHESQVFDFRESAPSDPTMHHVTDEQLSWGGYSVGVPGEVRGMWQAHQQFGKLRWQTLFEPVIRLAEDGFELADIVVADLNFRMESMGGLNRLKAISPELAERFEQLFDPTKVDEKDGKLWMRRPDLAKVLRRISEDGPEGFYEGEIAKEIVEAVAQAGGVMVLTDLEDFSVLTPQPISEVVAGHQIITTPAPSAGALLIRMLKKMEQNENNYKKSAPSTSKRNVDLATILRDAFRCKSLLGDALKNKEVATNERQLMDDLAEDFCQPADVAADQQGTSHISVIDAEELTVAVTHSINYWFGSMIVTKSGILLNNELRDFRLKSELNKPQPNARPLSSMVPTIVYHQQRPCLRRFAIGAVNGSKIVSGVGQVIGNILFGGMDLREALDAPRMYCNRNGCRQSFASSAYRGGEPTARGAGDDIEAVPFYLNAVAAVLKANNTLQAAADDYANWAPASF